MHSIEYMFTEEGQASGKAQVPIRKHYNDGGADLFSMENTVIPVGDFQKVGTGVRIKLPENTVGFINPRSGIAGKQGITVLNAPGTLDAGYRGEVEVVVINLGKEDFIINVGDRIAQLVVLPVYYPTFVLVDEFSDSEEDGQLRGDKGFGSTGVS